MRAALALALLLAPLLAPLLVACEAGDHEAGPDFEAPPALGVSLILEPDVLHIGEVVTAEISVLTPPDHRVLKVVPTKIPGLALLGIRTLEPERSAQRWLHRTRLRLRPETLGPHEWPAGFVEVEDAEGTIHRLTVPARPFEIASLQDRFAGRKEPFGLEEPAQGKADATGGFGRGVAVGVTLSLLAGLCTWGVRRRIERPAYRVAQRDEPPAVDLFDWTDGELREALEVLEADPRRAASAGAHLLRVYMARRFGSETEASTTEELEARTPALAERSLWPDFVRILHRFDDERFRPARVATLAARPESGRVLAALEDTRRLVEASKPHAARDRTG